jgi:hypothetical protein
METLLTKLSLLITIGLQVFILRLLVKRQLQRRFFWFLAYIIYALIEEGLRLSVSGNRTLYAKVYWWTEGGDVILAVLAVRESFLNVFREFTRLRWFTWLIWCSVGVALSYAAFRAWLFPPLRATRQGAIIIGLETAVDYSLTAVGLLYFAMLVFSRIRQHQWETGIISGFTLNASVAVMGLLTLSIFGKKFRILNEWIPAVAYIMAEIEWAIILNRSEKKALEPKQKSTVEDFTKLDRYIRMIQQFFRRKS